MTKFVIEVKLDNLEQMNSEERKKKFYEHIYQYMSCPYERNDNVTMIIFDIEEWEKIKKELPGKLDEIYEEIFIKDDTLCITNSANIGYDFSNLKKEYFEDTCIKIINNQNNVHLESTEKYIDQFIVKFIKSRMGSINPEKDFEFYESKLRESHSNGVKISKLQL